jgi:hypothetical protein
MQQVVCVLLLIESVAAVAVAVVAVRSIAMHSVLCVLLGTTLDLGMYCERLLQPIVCSICVSVWPKCELLCCHSVACAVL